MLLKYVLCFFTNQLNSFSNQKYKVIRWRESWQYTWTLNIEHYNTIFPQNNLFGRLPRWYSEISQKDNLTDLVFYPFNLFIYHIYPSSSTWTHETRPTWLWPYRSWTRNSESRGHARRSWKTWHKYLRLPRTPNLTWPSSRNCTRLATRWPNPSSSNTRESFWTLLRVHAK